MFSYYLPSITFYYFVSWIPIHLYRIVMLLLSRDKLLNSLKLSCKLQSIGTLFVHWFLYRYLYLRITYVGERGEDWCTSGIGARHSPPHSPLPLYEAGNRCLSSNFGASTLKLKLTWKRSFLSLHKKITRENVTILQIWWGILYFKNWDEILFVRLNDYNI